MATREENLKKINAELETMSDDELDQVAGGECSETANDSRFLNSLNGSCDRYGDDRIAWSFGVHNAEIEKAWSTVGIKAEVYFAQFPFGKSNKYYLDGQQITQEQARQHAMKVTGHYMTEKDWNW
ncbi:MAG: hypothetical protein SR1Q7_03160 [Quinella sp. 1Q7]|nr:hypothetical protein [Quinella sp. 1Q7]